MLTPQEQADEAAKLAELENDVELDDDTIGLLDDDAAGKIKTLAAQRAHHKEKRTAAEARAAQLEKDLEEARKAIPKVEKKEKPSDEIAALRRENAETRLLMKNPNLSSDDIALAFKLTEEGKSVEETVSGEYFQAYLGKKEEKAKIEASTPGPSNRGGNSARFTVADLSDPAKLNQMTPEDFAKLSDQASKQGSRYTSITEPTV